MSREEVIEEAARERVGDGATTLVQGYTVLVPGRRDDKAGKPT